MCSTSLQKTGELAPIVSANFPQASRVVVCRCLANFYAYSEWPAVNSQSLSFPNPYGNSFPGSTRGLPAGKCLEPPVAGQGPGAGARGETIGARQIQGELQQELPEGGDSLGCYPVLRPPQERSVLFLEGALRVNTDNTTCQQQLGGLLRALIAACIAKTQSAEVNAYGHKQLFTPFGLNPKTCKESAKDIFLHGEDLVGTYRVPPELVADGKVPDATVPLVQSLDFLKSWLVPLATAKKDALIWAGFWTDPHDPHGKQRRTSVEMLAEFASRTEHDTVHPDTVLGTLIEKHGALGRCRDTIEQHLVENLWKLASFAFVSGMREKGQNTVVALVNKELDGERSLQKSVLYQYEVPTLGLAAWGMGYWSPTVLLIDLKGTCSRTSPALRRQMFGALKPWYLDRRKDPGVKHHDFANLKKYWLMVRIIMTHYRSKNHSPNLSCQKERFLRLLLSLLLAEVFSLRR